MAAMVIYGHSVPTTTILAGVIVSAALIGVSFARLRAGRVLTVVLVILRAAFLLLLAWCLLQPTRKDSRARLRKPTFLAVLDRSRSMTQPRDADTASLNASNRWHAATRLLACPWRERLSADCRLDAYRLAGDVSPRMDLAHAAGDPPDGDATRLREGLRQLIERYKGQDVVGCVLLSDGIDTAEVSDTWTAQGWPWPIYTTHLVKETAVHVEPDVRVDTVDTPRRVSVGWKTELKTFISGQGTGGKPLSVQLRRDGTLVQELPLQLTDGRTGKDVTFQLSHPETGVFTYDVRVPPIRGETHTNDNRYAVSVQVVDARNRLLYVEGPPSWNSKYLVRALRANARVTPLTFVRGTGDQFLTTGPVGDMKPDMTEAQLALFKIVILGNLDAEELGDERSRNLIKFVDAGGSLILLGGTKGWSEDGFLKSPLRVLLPMSRLDGTPIENTSPTVLTDAGVGHPAFAGDPALWEHLPPILSVFPGAVPSPAAQSLLVADTPNGRHAVLMARAYGQGKVVAILTDSLWRWQLTPDTLDNQPYQRFWNQLLAWLSPAEKAVASESVDIFLDRNELYLGETVELSARLTGTEGVNDDLVMTCELTTPDARKLPYSMTRRNVVTPSGKAFAGFGLSYTADAPGLHTARAVTQADGALKTSEPVSFFVKPFTPESAPKPADTQVLKALAMHSRGRYFEQPAELADFLATLSFDSISETRVEYRTLWQRVAVISCLLGCLAAEWTVRKWRNMA